MKKRLAPRILMALALVVALIVLAAPVPRAGEYHDGATLYCQECHVMHYSQSHSYTGQTDPEFAGGSPTSTPPQAAMSGGAHEKLLRQEANALCLSCHNGQAAFPDVLGNDTLASARAGGALNQDDEDDYLDYMGHTLQSTDVAPGTTWNNDDGFKCVDCHEPHGYVPTGVTDVGASPVSSQYRNLRTNPGDGTALGVSYNVSPGAGPATRVPATDIYLRSWVLTAIASNYDADVMDLNEPSTSESGMGRWCGGCHGDFHNTSASGWVLHPTATANIGAGDETHSSEALFGGHDYRVKVMSSTGGWGDQGTPLGTPPTDLTPTCLSCHKSHGSGKPFGLIYATGDDELGESGDGDQLNYLCRQCHVQ